jgi:SNF2 family DNA or RNA helicase
MTSKYEILYFKRKNKVHKGKGVSKLDGLLVVEKGHVKLYEGSNTDQPPFYSSYSRVNFNREFQVDEELDFGIYHAEVVRIIDKEKSTEKDPTVVPKSLSNSIRKPLISRSSSLRNNAIEPSKKTLCKHESSSRLKRPLCSSVTEGVENEDIDSVFSRQLVGKKLTHHGHSRLQDSKMLTISNLKQQISSDVTSMPIESATLTLPNSIQRAIKPHQEDGVSFLWKAITGASESFQHISQIAGLDSAPRGAILADSMGTGMCEKYNPITIIIRLIQQLLDFQGKH